MNKIFLILMLLCFSLAKAQLNCQVVLNAEQTGRSNMPVFKTLESAIQSFMTETTWAETSLENHERINCSIFINILEFDGNSFTGTIQVQSSRPVFNSTFTSPVFNFNDEQLNFSYQEHQPLRYDRNSYSSNLVSVLAFYAYTILGLDADTFAPQGGNEFFKEASQVVGVAQQGRMSGWGPADGNKSRYRLNTDLLSNSFLGYREALYTYHRQGMDLMVNETEQAKKNIAASLQNLEKMNSRRGNSLLLRIFFDAKAAEIEKIFSGGPTIPIAEVISTLNNIAPSYSSNWKNIRY